MMRHSTGAILFVINLIGQVAHLQEEHDQFRALWAGCSQMHEPILQRAINYHDSGHPALLRLFRQSHPRNFHSAYFCRHTWVNTCPIHHGV